MKYLADEIFRTMLMSIIEFTIDKSLNALFEMWANMMLAIASTANQIAPSIFFGIPFLFVSQFIYRVVIKRTDKSHYRRFQKKPWKTIEKCLTDKSLRFFGRVYITTFGYLVMFFGLVLSTASPANAIGQNQQCYKLEHMRTRALSEKRFNSVRTRNEGEEKVQVCCWTTSHPYSEIPKDPSRAALWHTLPAQDSHQLNNNSHNTPHPPILSMARG